MLQNYLTRKSLLLLTSFLFFFLTINSQITINKPVLGFTEVCSNPTFNTFNLSFAFSPVSNLITGNIFNIEISDSTGSFTNPILLTTTNGISSPLSVSFSIPTNLSGTGFKIRVKSTSPVATSLQSNAFSINYAVYNQPYTINNNIGNQSFCGNSTFTLKTDPGINSPLNFNMLTYIWYKNSILIPNETSSSLVISQAGSYFSKINYGTCVSNISKSNAVTMTQVAAQVLTITSPSTLLCGIATIPLSTSIAPNGYIYEWYKDNQPLTNSNVSSYNATLPGSYFLKITNNACITQSNIITLTTQNFNLALDSGPTSKMIPGQNITLNATTSAVSPIYKWYKNTVLQAATTASYSTNTAGSYKLVVKEGIGCLAEKEISTVLSYPSNYNYVINHVAPFTDCVSTSTTLGITQFSTIPNINVLTSGAPINYKWYKRFGSDIILLNVFTNTLNISSNDLGSGIYLMEATFNDGSVATSNQISVRFKFDPNVLITSNQLFICNANPTVTLRSSVTNLAYTYNWFKTGSTTSLGSNPVFVVSIAGDYFLKVSNDGCEVISNTISIKKAGESLQTNQPETIVLTTNQPITITASGADLYSWTSTFTTVENLTPNFTLNQAGTVTLTATLGSCTVIKNFSISKSTKVFSSLIPNAISPNNDGINDTWILPEEFAYKDDIEVIIFSSKNEIMYQTKNYLNNWPLVEVANKTVYFYKILQNNSVLEKGTVSVLK